MKRVVMPLLAVFAVLLWPVTDAGLATTGPGRSSGVVGHPSAQLVSSVEFVSAPLVSAELVSSVGFASASSVPSAELVAFAELSTTPAKATRVPPGARVARPVRRVAPIQRFDVAVVIAIITSIWPADQLQKALDVAWRESRYQPTAQNACCYGLFQINWLANQAWLISVGITGPGQLLDPTTNATVALKMYLISGWAPWGG